MESQYTPGVQYSWEQIQGMMADLILSQKETDKKFQETDKLLTEKFQETDKKFQESREQQKETERILKESILELRDEINKTNKRMGGLGNSWGSFLEGMAKPGLLEYFTNKGIEVHYCFSNVKEYRDVKLFYEIDLLLFNDIYVIAVEVKSKLLDEHINNHVERLRRLQEQPPKVFNLHGKIVIGAIATISAEPTDVEKAIQSGFFVLVQKSNIMVAINPPDFKPKEWLLE